MEHISSIPFYPRMEFLFSTVFFLSYLTGSKLRVEINYFLCKDQGENFYVL